MADTLKTFQVHLAAVMDSLVRASVCEISKLFQDTVNEYLVEISLNRKENEALKLRLRLTENKLRNERKYGLSWAGRRAGLLAPSAGGPEKRKVEVARRNATKEWSNRTWEVEAEEEEAGGGKVREEDADIYLVHLPRGEKEEEARKKRRSSAEGREPASIKEECSEQEAGYKPGSLHVIKEALQMEPSEPSVPCHQPDGEQDPVAQLDDQSTSCMSGTQDDWEAGPGCGPGMDENGACVEELSGLEKALKAEREKEETWSRLGSPATLTATADREDVDYVTSPKYIGLDGLCSSQQQSPPPQRAGAAVMGWPKRPKEQAADSPPPLEEAGRQQIPSANESLEEESGAEGGEFLHYCPQCGGGFKCTADLEEHPCPAAGGEGQPLPCAACDHSFSHAWSPKSHECVPNGERPHRCELCGKHFTHSRSLERHQLVHTGERPHQCPQCGRSFSRLGNLERHQRIHTGERPYQCGACGKRFSRVEYLKRHQHIHSGDRAGGHAAQCPHCGKTCGDAEQLKKHQCVHGM
ncbi:zinc finger protein 436 [Denticeps clupeoides]|uniref:C2H2-type domain-containing protein n=1 Tax=Denticeps clupeoides TaxID=299321 RepID=A0AAY4E0T2_9TELE|nr:zinc finger protein 436-like [Denticeps clupeoides]